MGQRIAEYGRHNYYEEEKILRSVHIQLPPIRGYCAPDNVSSMVARNMSSVAVF